jgi:monoamine oxidase
MGYINFGVMQSTRGPGRPPARATHTGTVVVVGAGCAGLAAARQLQRKGYRVVIVEAKPRPGGRVHTVRLEGPAGSAAAVADMGGSILTGIDGNPLAVVAKQLGLPLFDINTELTPLYMAEGQEADLEIDRAVGCLFLLYFIFKYLFFL